MKQEQDIFWQYRSGPEFASEKRAVCYVVLADYEHTIGGFKRALELDTKYAEPYFNLNVVYSRLNDKKAAEFYKKAHDKLTAAAPGA